MRVISSDSILETSNPVVFNTLLYNDMNRVQPIRSYALIDSQNQIVATISFHIQDSCAISLPRAPYAGIDSTEGLVSSDFDALMEFLLIDLKSIGVREIKIKQGPSFIALTVRKGLLKAINKAGFGQRPVEVNHHYNLMECDDPTMHNMQTRKISKCKKAALRFEKSSSAQLEECHAFITKCRLQQGIEINITLDALKDAFALFPDFYSLFCIRNPTGALLACTIALKVNDEVEYNYLPAFDRMYKEYSPLTLLYLELFRYFKKEGMSYLDLGASSVDGKMQEGLSLFKERMGAVRTERPVFVYTY